MLTRAEWQASRKERLHHHFHRYKDDQSYEEMTAEIKNKPHKSCPHCNSFSTVRHGKYRDRQRYKCKDCSRTFNDFTNTPLHGTHHPKKWTKFLQCIREGYSLRRSQVHVGVSWVTLFYWRHKLTHALLTTEQQTTKSGILAVKQPVIQSSRLTVDLKDIYPYICVKNNPPLYLVQFWERELFQKWVCHFDWIARKYIKRYVAWFHAVQKVERKMEWDAMKSIFVQACSVSIAQTYKSLRQSNAS